MKKFFIVALAVMSISFVSCKKQTVEDQAKDYAEKVISAIKSGKESAMSQLDTEIEEWMKGLSAEDQTKVKAIIEEASLKGFAEAMGCSVDELKNMGGAEDPEVAEYEAMVKAAEEAEAAGEAEEE